MSAQDQSKNRLVDVVLDSDSFGRATPDVEHERAVAIFDLIEENSFRPEGDEGGPYNCRFRWPKTASSSTSRVKMAAR